MEHRAKRSLGQNFLIDDNICRRIVDALDVGDDSLIVEIGPGKGALSRFLLQASPRKYIALEKDAALAEALSDRYPQARVRCMDALQFPWEDLTGRVQIVGNLPYNIGSRLIWDIVSRVQSYDRAIFMVQLEVAQRLTAKAGEKAYGALGAWVQSFAETQLLFRVPPTVFRPQPKVMSGVVRFTPLGVECRPADPVALSEVLRLCFQKRRKQLGNILRTRWNDELSQWFAEEGLSPTLRPEALTPRQFQGLAARIVMNNAES
ncbi:16S rRNA (adenine1518-N6/adenine1519-N6)-dimethyltransferase [Paucidesulfovibrio gracilis DSM 16080]|uniref:Ribosomal RNA small subunit methyltransferase A n=1 Tax=Paucidesulfovibrio gracilis DSM 16080 TaxID=1121449 RepID=A0A1T4WMC4_9BACT|nr:16S rRNA (adenine(1518)-N(6)/adenine(1519)-N(6))-dimethyltransferase RsmA [Paucidesulfovibrio gracilis]SKA78484.1 16S rRNA (adenine1518-N6/adenine1519-N6)-dimethyltransferase [Paucidesulfovibrio gracilis DSM 16080]